MNELKLNEKLRLLAIKAILKLNQITHKNQLNSSKNAERFGPLENITKYLGAKKISLQLHERDEEKKALNKILHDKNPKRPTIKKKSQHNKSYI